MKVVVDIGNSNVVIAIHSNNDWIHLWRMPTIKTDDAPRFYNLEVRTRLLESGFEIEEVSGIILSTVVPFLKETCLLYTSPSPRD